MLKDAFGLAEHQEKATYGLGYKLTLTRNKDDAALHKAVTLADARIKIDNIHWYVPHYTPSIQQQGKLSKQISSKTPTELRDVERSVFMKQVNNQNLWNFELGSQESMNVQIWIIVGFQQKDWQDSQKLKCNRFCRLPFTSAKCVIWTENYTDAGILLNYDDDCYSQGYGHIEEAFRTFTKGNIFKP